MDNSKIEWTDATWNPVRGCTRVSQGCVNCYAEGVAARFSDPGMPYHGLAKRTKAGPRWTGEIAFVEKALDQPLRWRKPRRIFVNSMSDLFHEKVTDDQLDRIFAVMALVPRHVFQVLTKRPERMRAYCRTVTLSRLLAASQGMRADDVAVSWPLENVWLGTSVENQETADERIPPLLETPAAVRFLSCEPLLGPVNIEGFLQPPPWLPGRNVRLSPGRWILDADGAHLMWRGLDWLICGGESGPGARPMHPQWARDLRGQCVAAGMSFFFKQWGAWRPAVLQELDGDFSWPTPEHDTSKDVFGDGTWMWKVGKGYAGRALDGRTWDEMPGERPTDGRARDAAD